MYLELSSIDDNPEPSEESAELTEFLVEKIVRLFPNVNNLSGGSGPQMACVQLAIVGNEAFAVGNAAGRAVVYHGRRQ